MTFEEAEALLDRITYKPGISFTLMSSNAHTNPGPGTGVDFYIWEDMVLDSRGGVRPLSRGSRRRITPLSLVNESLFLEEVRHAVLDHERHEADEWLQLDGRPLFDPHK